MLPNPNFSDFEMARKPLAREQSVLVLVDIQEKLLPPIHEKDRLVRNAQLLIHLAGILHLPVLLTAQYSKGLGATVPEIANLLPGTTPLEKLEFGCFSNQGFCATVKELPPQRNTLLLAGMETHICVMQTALGALDRGYLVHVASDAVGSRDEWNWTIGLERMRNAGAVISSTETIIYELLRGSGSAEFKEMLKYLKA